MHQVRVHKPVWWPLLTLRRYVEFAMHRVRMLIYFGVTPYLVFDGDNLPSKASTESERAKKREESKRKGLELYKARKISQAYPDFQKAVDVTPYMARQLIEELKRMNIQYVVAPYEADAQLAYLEQKGIIDGILSEDSDLLVYGAKRLITKLDQHGDCIEISRSDFAACRDMTLAGFTDADFRSMAILSGCDYLASINKIGLKTAHTYVRKYKNVERILRMLQFEQKFTVPSGYLEQFYEAERTFLHHRVFCPLQKKLVFVTELESGMKEEDMPYLGNNVSPETAIGVACGELDPMTKKPIRVNAATSSRSMPDLHRRQTIASANDLKPSKSIGNFFKPKRQPLAELDPNSLTPSPSQQRLLNLHGNTSWEARPFSSAPQLRRSNSGLSVPAREAAFPDRQNERSSFLERAATLSKFQPSKRTRLCSDIDVSPSGKDTQSPFFAAASEPSPSIRKRNKTKKARRSDIEIFSDDSIDDIFHDLQESEANAAAISIVPGTQTHNSESRDNQGLALAQTSITGVCDTPIRQTINIPQSTISQSTPVISISAKDDPEDFQDLVEIHVKQLNNLRNTFAYQSPERQAAALQQLSPSSDLPKSVSQEEPIIGDQATEENTVRPFQETTRPQRSLSGQPLQKTFGKQSSSQQAAALNSLGQSQSSTQKVNLGLVAQNSAFHLGTQQRPLTPLEQLGKRALKKPTILTPPTSQVAAGTAKGSEDLLVPNSEDDASELSEVDEAMPARKVIDLNRFAFTAGA
jgi:exonuclease 1